ncbi:MAG: LysM peptidoglycan-binding domain-containing protein [Spirochaetales bacterium]|nr:LysM peptidoglycan-binding domain-containing protein [Spirochaetales bacterium]
MGAGSIGIKLADSKFFPVLEEGNPASKILELTTVRDEQTSVQINLFRSEDGELDESAYVGTLIIEDISPRASGEPTVELTLTLDEQNELSAEAVDLDSGSRQALSVSLETLSREDLYSLPDFDLSPIDSSLHLGEDPDHRNLAYQGTIPGNAPEGLYEMTNEEEKKSGVFMPAWLCVLVLVVGVLALVLALLVSARVMMLNRSMQAQQAAREELATEQVVPASEPAPAPVAPAEPTPPPSTQESEPVATVVEEPVVPEPAEPVSNAKPVNYKIKWGDTLWDLSEAYYDNPWRYTDISKHNKIRNPNLIIAGTRIEIPPK